MCIVGQRIEKKVRNPMTRKVIFVERHSLCKDKSCRVYPALLRLTLVAIGQGQQWQEIRNSSYRIGTITTRKDGRKIATVATSAPIVP